MLTPPGPIKSPTTMSAIPTRTPPRTMVTIPQITRTAATIHKSSDVAPPHPLAASGASIGLLDAVDRASGRHRDLVVRVVRRAAEPRHAAGSTRADPPRPLPVPAALAAVALVRPAQEVGSVQGTGLVHGGPRPLLPPADGMGLSRPAGVRAHPVEPGVRPRAGAHRRLVRRRPVRQRVFLVHPRDRIRGGERLDPSRRGPRGGNRARALRRGDRLPARPVPGVQPSRGRRAVARRSSGVSSLRPRAPPPDG